MLGHNAIKISGARWFIRGCRAGGRRFVSQKWLCCSSLASWGQLFLPPHQQCPSFPSVLQFSSTCSGPACHTTGFLVALQQSQPSSSKPKGSQCPPAFFFFSPIRKFRDFSSGCALCALAPPWVPGLARGASAPGASGEEPLLVLKTGPKKCVTLKSYRKNQEYR